MIINDLDITQSYSFTDIENMLAQKGGAWILRFEETDGDGHTYAAVIAADGSCGWWQTKNDILIPWEDSAYDGYDIFPELATGLASCSKAPLSQGIIALDNEAVIAWLNDDPRIPETCVSYILDTQKDLDWEQDDHIALQKVLTDIAAACADTTFTLTLNSDFSKGRHISQVKQDKNMQTMLAEQSIPLWPGQDAHYEGRPYAEYSYPGLDYKSPTLTAFVAVSEHIMATANCNLEGWERDYNDGAYHGASGYSAGAQTLEINVTLSGHERMEAIRRAHAYLETLDVDAARVLLNTLRHEETMS